MNKCTKITLLFLSFIFIQFESLSQCKVGSSGIYRSGAESGTQNVIPISGIAGGTLSPVVLSVPGCTNKNSINPFNVTNTITELVGAHSTHIKTLTYTSPNSNYSYFRVIEGSVPKKSAGVFSNPNFIKINGNTIFNNIHEISSWVFRPWQNIVAQTYWRTSATVSRLVFCISSTTINLI